MPKSKGKGKNVPREIKQQQKERAEQEISDLKKRCIEEAPARGYAPPLSQVVAFRALPLSEPTLRGLDGAKTPFTTMTAIQNACIPHALAGRDILGAARTGSGKTLAFLVPLLEKLYRERFTPHDGPGAAVLSPTRELAVQIFQVLKVVGKHHSFSVGLLIGGKKDFFQEQEMLNTTNIIIATPGRLLQHLEQTPYFDMSQLQVLVLDEADRILDMGFRDQLVRILDYLPSSGEQRQTMLFSATQTRDVSSLATLSLKQPEYIGVHDKEKTETPDSLQQSYVVVPLEHKLNAVYSFIRTHLKSKSIIFMATCAQIRHAWELFCSLRPGVSVLALHGKLSQERRTRIYFDFIQRPHAILFATDIAARGLDFPNVDWVVQADAPEDRDMYIHRAGRTARYRAGGKSLLMLTPAEEKKGFVEIVQGKGSKKVPLKKLSINPTKAAIVTERAASAVASNVRLNDLAKKAFKSYVRSISLMPLKEVFDVKDLDVEGFGKSLGLASTPNIGFLKNAAQDREEFREKKNVNKKLQRLKEQIKAEKLAKKLQKMGKPVSADTLNMSKTNNSDSDDDDDDESDDEILVTKSRQDWRDDEEDLPDAGVHEVSKTRHPKKIRVEGSNAKDNKHVVFTEDGEEEDARGVLKPNTDENIEMIKKDKQKLEEATDEYMKKVRERLESTREKDLAEHKERVRQKHKKRRLQEKEALDGGEGMATVATLGTPPDDDASESGSEAATNSSSSVDSSSDDDDSSTSSSNEDAEADLKEQEDLALSLIRGGASS